MVGATTAVFEDNCRFGVEEFEDKFERLESAFGLPDEDILLPLPTAGTELDRVKGVDGGWEFCIKDTELPFVGEEPAGGEFPAEPEAGVFFFDSKDSMTDRTEI